MERKLRNQFVSLEEIDDEADEHGLSIDLFLYTHRLIDDSPESKYALTESLEILDRALQMLKTREREVLVRRILYRDSLHDIAADYDVKPETISVMLVRAKHAIAAVITTLSD